MPDHISHSNSPTEHREQHDFNAPVSQPPTSPILMQPCAQEIAVLCSSVPGTSVDFPRIEATPRCPPIQELDLPPLTHDQEELPVLVSSARLPNTTMPTPIMPSFSLPTFGMSTATTRPRTPTLPSTTMPTPTVPTLPMQQEGISGASVLSGYISSPFRHVSPSLTLDQHLPLHRQSTPTYLFSAPLPPREEPALPTATTPFERYLRNPHIHERSRTDSPPLHLSGSGREIEEFDRIEYLDLSPDLPEGVQLPADVHIPGETQAQQKTPVLPDGTPSHVEMIAAFQKHIQDKCSKEEQSPMAPPNRHELPMRGMKMQELRCELHNWFKAWIMNHGPVPVATQKDFAFLLIESDVYEDKLAAVLFIQEVLIFRNQISITDMPSFESIFRGGYIKVYKICDHFTDKVLCYLARQVVQEEQQVMINTLFEWTQADDVWQARAGLSALSNQAGNVLLHDRLLQAVKHMMSRPEEEAKSMAGTALRSISDVDAAKVIDFLSQSEIIANTSVHALAKATSRLTHARKQYFKTLRQEVKATNT